MSFEGFGDYAVSARNYTSRSFCPVLTILALSVRFAHVGGSRSDEADCTLIDES